ncbi:sugar transferase [Bordetella pseudohinzii]|uniref:Putative colanic biosynthesis UDP-glucose lipid carrier transferase n=1 Tax=Bordetella pseudohinzii TaxID=1331258 RepID=A0A0J6C6J7_9BORD|nr:sugar transferase [Bordetella pseudohinzii]ANY17998.1 sugar transferase [Bordetella pseudohinzii]KMM26346.1 sugar transferase [Bordetella pseudohinzii]KXA79571.1 sugar transferase [Bordetella pseudohinzii]KXA80850.1 sugar transferase [Bordetella pseudohinzii]CUI80822.1 Putative colanic biosynthesis UDP-glucose lipid carrier transferase [Bordetella pseudohinzii]
MIKRAFDLICSALGLLLLSPLLLLVAIAIKLDSPGPVFFRQERIGRHGKPFRIHKLRSMTQRQSAQASQITIGADARITRVGALIRRWKLDELVQLIDVFQGNMSLVGPRPEVPRYVALYPSDVAGLVLSVRPGITDPASIHFRNENELLGKAQDPEKMYRETILPEKLRLQAAYVQEQSFFGDIAIILRTICSIGR